MQTSALSKVLATAAILLALGLVVMVVVESVRPVAPSASEVHVWADCGDYELGLCRDGSVIWREKERRPVAPIRPIRPKPQPKPDGDIGEPLGEIGSVS